MRTRRKLRAPLQLPDVDDLPEAISATVVPHTAAQDLLLLVRAMQVRG